MNPTGSIHPVDGMVNIFIYVQICLPQNKCRPWVCDEKIVDHHEYEVNYIMLK